MAAPLLQEDTESQGVGGGPPRNSVALIDRHGEIGYVYSKVHTCVWGADEALTAPGRHFFTASIDVVSHGTGLGVSLRPLHLLSGALASARALPHCKIIVTNPTSIGNTPCSRNV